ncbi:hypothetical protein B0T24DRAFT_377237 [Lasiosphaeria ovina]|uniref:Uncharacterized protein n=1 Tax=Lasiosphaeria ovina TaxID=92902 RepID=A0AAE0N1T7_9PEZI|nr:hypothetical protein B0T24DRAFT_377237 [Lasiosphaeria ovina]
MATIEPRLIHLLNNSQTPDLPPIQLLPFSPSADQSLSLPPLGSDGGHRGDKSAPNQIPPIYAPGDEHAPKQPPPRVESAYGNDHNSALNKPARPLQRLLVGELEPSVSTLSLRMIVGDNIPDNSEDLSTKKRHRALTNKEDFVQLPQPLKKQKSTQQVVPPIINGLHEPPPNAAVFPPITGSFDDNEALNLGMLKDFTNGTEERALTAPTSDAEKNNANGNSTGPKVKRRATKPRRKWSDEETNHLLLGVNRHGVGKWTSILEDPDFKFNDRTAGDLKDRFRTCCPDELRGGTGMGKKRSGKDPVDTPAPPPPPPPPPAPEDNPRPRNGPLLENILIEPGGAADSDGPSLYPPQTPDSGPKQRKSRAHRKKIEDLEELGIRGPFKKSHRRERRPFTDQDDKEILEGLDQYGPAWTKIQRDPKYNLSSRQPTDLRDRVRNKYPNIYARIEKGSFYTKEPGRGGNLLEPSVNTSMENSLHPNMPGTLEPQLNKSGSKDDMRKWGYFESSESLPALTDPYTNEHPASSSSYVATNNSSAPEMDIGRLLLDDSQITNDSHARPGPYDGSPNATSPSGGPTDPRFPKPR